MRKRIRLNGFVTVEMAVVLGIYLTILGTFICTSIEIYKQVTSSAEKHVEIENVADICKQKRLLELWNNLQDD